MLETVLTFENVCKSFLDSVQKKIIVLNNANLTLKEGEVVALLGPSGIGKTTTLQLAGLLDSQNSGTIKIEGEEASNDKKSTIIRKNKIGFVYQFHHLMEELNVLRNVCLPLLVMGYTQNEAKQKAMSVLQEVGLEDLYKRKISELSGGQKQRVAVARAVVKCPKLIIADEPTGNLDVENSEAVFNLIVNCAKQNNSTVLVATHNLDFANKSDRVLKLENFNFTEI